jgi:hypothetical protein
MALLPQIGSNTRATAYINSTPDQDILAQLCLAAMNEHELQIISATIEVQTATPAWSLQHSIVHYNDRCGIPATSPIL